MNFQSIKNVLIIAELSANHGQKLEFALETVKAAKRAGADAIKLQTYTPDTMTIDCNNKYFSSLLKGSIWEGNKFYDLYKEAYTPWEWHAQIFQCAKDEGLLCFSTPFDKSSVDFLEQFNPPAYKIASFEIQDIPLINYTAAKMRPMIMSTGMATKEDIQEAINACNQQGNYDITILKCTSSYPAPMDEANLKTLLAMKEDFGVQVGLSDHTLGFLAPITAVALGAKVIEKHFIVDKSIGGPDASFSMDEKEFTEMVKFVRSAEKALGTVLYDLTPKAIENKKFGRSIFIVKDIKAGQLFTEQNIRVIRPSFGLHPKYYDTILGQKASMNIERGTPLESHHFKKINP